MRSPVASFQDCRSSLFAHNEIVTEDLGIAKKLSNSFEDRQLGTSF